VIGGPDLAHRNNPLVTVCVIPRIANESHSHRHKEQKMIKTVSFGMVHLSVAFTVVYVLTGDVLISSAVALIEPLVNTVVYHFFEKYWTRYNLSRRWASMRSRQAASVLRLAGRVSVYFSRRPANAGLRVGAPAMGQRA
jgi:uncharacterized membrane protein